MTQPTCVTYSYVLNVLNVLQTCVKMSYDSTNKKHGTYNSGLHVKTRYMFKHKLHIKSIVAYNKTSYILNKQTSIKLWLNNELNLKQLKRDIVNVWPKAWVAYKTNGNNNTSKVMTKHELHVKGNKL